MIFDQAPLGGRNQVSDYCTIMVISTIAKLYSVIMEQKISAWVESRNKQVIGQHVGVRQNTP